MSRTTPVAAMALATRLLTLKSIWSGVGRELITGARWSSAAVAPGSGVSGHTAQLA